MVNVAIQTICDMVDHCRQRLDDITPVVTVPLTNQELIDAAAEEADESELLWTESELRHYANEAIREVALRARCIRDGNRNVTGLTRIVMLSGVRQTVLDDRILVIKKVWWRDGDDVETVLTPESELFLDQAESGLSSTSWRADSITKPTKYALHRMDRRLELVGAPTEDGTLLIECIRYPLEVIETGVPEIPQHYLADCLDWMCHLAYLKNDADTFDPAKAASFSAMFDNKVGPRPTNLQLELEYYQAGRRRPRLYYY